jgi:ribonuclease D
MTPPLLITSDAELAALTSRLARTERLAVDVEANGLFAYRPKLCVLQLAWQEQDRLELAIIDPLLVPVTPLATVLGRLGPTKILHDLTFDVRMLAEHAIDVDNIRDTSVAARFLGEPATGLANLCHKRFGVVLSKALQEHDWSRRPLGERELGYLCNDVRYLLALDEVLAHEAHARGIEDEVRIECAYKLATAKNAPRDERPLHARIKGYHKLDAIGRSVLSRLVATREALAATRDVPPFRIVSSSLLLELARRKPSSHDEVRRSCGRDRAALRFVSEWRAAVSRGLADGPEPHVAPPAPPPDLALRRAIERTLGEWRREHASARGVDPQVVLPRHCVEHVVTALMSHADDKTALRGALERVAGFGSCRVARYFDSLAAIQPVRQE